MNTRHSMWKEHLHHVIWYADLHRSIVNRFNCWHNLCLVHPDPVKELVVTLVKDRTIFTKSWIKLANDEHPHHFNVLLFRLNIPHFNIRKPRGGRLTPPTSLLSNDVFSNQQINKIIQYLAKLSDVFKKKTWNAYFVTYTSCFVSDTMKIGWVGLKYEFIWGEIRTSITQVTYRDVHSFLKKRFDESNG